MKLDNVDRMLQNAFFIQTADGLHGLYNIPYHRCSYISAYRMITGNVFEQYKECIDKVLYAMVSFQPTFTSNGTKPLFLQKWKKWPLPLHCKHEKVQRI